VRLHRKRAPAIGHPRAISRACESRHDK
jgi:hypothetical protein